MFFELDSFFRLDASIKQQFEKDHFFLVLSDFFHFDDSLVKSVDESQKGVQLLWSVKNFIFRRFLWQIPISWRDILGGFQSRDSFLRISCVDSFLIGFCNPLRQINVLL